MDEGHAFNFFQGFQVGTSSNGTTVAPLHRLGSQTCGAGLNSCLGFLPLLRRRKTRGGQIWSQRFGRLRRICQGLQSEVNWVLGRMDEVGDQSLLWRSFRICCLYEVDRNCDTIWTICCANFAFCSVKSLHYPHIHMRVTWRSTS